MLSDDDLRRIADVLATKFGYYSDGLCYCDIHDKQRWGVREKQGEIAAILREELEKLTTYASIDSLRRCSADPHLSVVHTTDD